MEIPRVVERAASLATITGLLTLAACGPFSESPIVPLDCETAMAVAERPSTSPGVDQISGEVVPGSVKQITDGSSPKYQFRLHPDTGNAASQNPNAQVQVEASNSTAETNFAEPFTDITVLLSDKAPYRTVLLGGGKSSCVVEGVIFEVKPPSH